MTASYLNPWPNASEGAKAISYQLQALSVVRQRILPASLTMLDVFVCGRRQSLAGRMVAFYKARIYRQTSLGNLGLLVAAVLGKVYRYTFVC